MTHRVSEASAGGWERKPRCPEPASRPGARRSGSACGSAPGFPWRSHRACLEGGGSSGSESEAHAWSFRLVLQRVHGRLLGGLCSERPVSLVLDALLGWGAPPRGTFQGSPVFTPWKRQMSYLATSLHFQSISELCS